MKSRLKKLQKTEETGENFRAEVVKQRVQNTAARIVTSASKYEHITPVLADLHWLPVAARIDFKIAVLTFKALAMH